MNVRNGAGTPRAASTRRHSSVASEPTGVSFGADLGPRGGGRQATGGEHEERGRHGGGRLGEPARAGDRDDEDGGQEADRERGHRRNR